MTQGPATTAFGMVIGDRTGVPAADGGTLASTDPATGRPWAQIADATPEDVSRAVDGARRAFVGEWGRLAPSERGRRLLRWGELVQARASELAVRESRDNGRLLRDATAQARFVGDWLHYYGGLADKVHGRVVPVPQRDVLTYTLRQPLGVVAVITPWNAPMMLTAMAAGPALAAGNTVVVKPSELASASVVELAALALEAGLPPGAFSAVTGGAAAGRSLVDNPVVRQVTFTGGTETGKAVGASAMGRLAPVLLELGGKSANLVFGDADLDEASLGLIGGAFGAAGQTCIAASRALVHESVLPEVVERVAARANAMVVGHPRSDETEMGPLISAEHRRRIDDWVSEAKNAGATVPAGGEILVVAEAPDGFFYRPTVLTDVEPEAPLAREEVFGPLLVVMPFSEETEAVELANRTRFGLAAGVWTRDVKRAHRVAHALDAGTVWVNMYRTLSASVPFGGIKESGVGREGGVDAMDEFLQSKAVWCDIGEGSPDAFVLRT